MSTLKNKNRTKNRTKKSEQSGGEGIISGNHITFHLGPGEKIFADTTALVSMQSDIDINTETSSSFVSQLISGGDILVTTFQNNNPSITKNVVLSSKLPGTSIIKVDIRGTLCTKPRMYIAYSPTVKASISTVKSSSYLLTGQLFYTAFNVVTEYTKKEDTKKEDTENEENNEGTGTIWLQICGDCKVYDLAKDEQIIIDDDNLVAFDEIVQQEIKMLGTSFVSFFGGQKLAIQFTGPGRVFVQTSTTKDLYEVINQFMPKNSSSSNNSWW